MLLLVTGCNQSSDQRDFERAAFSLPEGITETSGNGTVINSDPDDWRISPFFQGVVQIDPAYPNPVLSSNQVSLDVIITGTDAVSELIVYAYYGNNNVRPVFEDFRAPVPTGLTSLPLSPLDIARFRENPQGTYRIVLLDGNENVISYGDIRVE
ncbi:hypothetical protein [Rhodohalobacter barkolensis]|uniref:Uncharacterized protein n=1 Tax=Rhodohalobacter barkolensis TaxID=2053187 RepID=A0A2N0VLF5_9BACT|nr:hypothetical protein [Rhodohalobacter barkolensis]PKD45020.1 hypothetical protein CWD77_06075 [Rhodohalobacter barkolensis]